MVLTPPDAVWTFGARLTRRQANRKRRADAKDITGQLPAMKMVLVNRDSGLLPLGGEQLEVDRSAEQIIIVQVMVQ